MDRDRQKLLTKLRARIARLEHDAPGSGAGRAHLPFGVADLDARLPGGGLRLGAMHEVVPAGPDLPHAAACLLFVAGILARLEACDEAGRLAVPADLADRPDPQARPLGAAAG